MVGSTTWNGIIELEPKNNLIFYRGWSPLCIKPSRTGYRERFTIVELLPVSSESPGLHGAIRSSRKRTFSSRTRILALRLSERLRFSMTATRNIKSRSFTDSAKLMAPSSADQAPTRWSKASRRCTLMFSTIKSNAHKIPVWVYALFGIALIMVFIEEKNRKRGQEIVKKIMTEINQMLFSLFNSLKTFVADMTPLMDSIIEYTLVGNLIMLENTAEMLEQVKQIDLRYEPASVE